MTQYRFYTDLAPWWPLISPPEEYADEAEFLAGLLRTAAVPVREVLELGSGGGHNASYLRGSFDLTLLDAAEPMLAVSRRLNPGTPHHLGDMRTVRLGRDFDAVLVHDAVDYMTTEADLRAAVGTAYAHCRPGGVAVFVPDHTRQTFAPSTDCGGADGPDGRGARYLEWTWDGRDGTAVTAYAFVLRDADGTLHDAYETHVTGLFPRSTWMRVLADAGFTPSRITERALAGRPRDAFLGYR